MHSNRLALFEASPISPVSDTNERTLPEEILLLHFGSNSYTRNGVNGEILFTEEDADNILADFEKRGKDLVIDYEHQSLSGEKAPAAGWIHILEKDARGLLARIKYWTKEAEEFLLRGEYRYFSPTLCFSRKGKSLSAIHSVALTNHPAMHGLDPLAAGDLDHSAGDEESKEEKEDEAEFIYAGNHTFSQDPPEDIVEEILEKAGLLSLASEEKVRRKELLFSHLSLLQEKAENAENFLSGHHLKSFQEAALKLKEAEKLSAEEMLRQAFSQGKLTESMRNWAEALADSSPGLFQEYLKTAPRIVPGNDVPAASFEEKGVKQSFSDEEEKIFAMLGLSAEEIVKFPERFPENIF